MQEIYCVALKIKLESEAHHLGVSSPKLTMSKLCFDGLVAIKT